MPNYLNEYLAQYAEPVQNKRIIAHQYEELSSDEEEKPQLNPFFDDYMSSDEEEIDLNYILENCPPTNIVREYMNAQLESIRGEDDELFLGGDKKKK